MGNDTGRRELAPELDRKLRQAIGQWRDQLINLTRSNRLLYFRHTRTASLEISVPDSDGIVDLLNRRKHWTFFEPPVDEDGEPTSTGPRPRASELVTDRRTPKELQGALRALERRALETFNERGLWTLYLGLGCLDWIDPADKKPVESPILLYPVRFNRASVNDQFRLWGSDEDVVINPALVVKFANDFDIDLPALDDLDDVKPSVVAAAVRTAVASLGWQVRDRCVLHPFAFAKEAMYRDLLDNEDEIATHPLVATLALGTDSGFARQFNFDPPDLDELDVLAPPEDLANVLDADSSQRRCIVAATHGQTFVMDGPPGTGKSQTITNIIAELVNLGRSVLFVSEKAAALDVVRSRLEDRGLAPFLLELHSHKASRREVAATLGAALAQRPRAGERETDPARLRRTRAQLTEYAKSVATAHPRVGRSPAAIVARLVALRHAFALPPPVRDFETYDQSFVAEVLERAEMLGRSWGPVARGDQFVWRDLRDPQRAAHRAGELGRLALDCEQAAAVLSDIQAAVTDELELDGWSAPDHASRLVHLLDVVDHRFDCPTSWLTAQSLESTRSALHTVRDSSERLHEAIATFIASPGWRQIDPADQVGLSGLETGIAGVWFGLRLPPSTDTVALSAFRQAVSDTAAMIDAQRDDVEIVVNAFGTRQPATLARAEELGHLAELVGSTHPPDAAWLDPGTASLLGPARAVLAAATADAKSRAESLREIFRQEVVDLDLRGLRARFKDVHLGFRKLGRAYRSDKRTLASAVVSGKVTADVIARLDDAVAYQDSVNELRKQEGAHGGALGTRYYRGVDTDFGEVEAAIAIAVEALRLARGEASPETLRSRLTVGPGFETELHDAGARIHRLFDAWKHDVAPLLGVDSVTLDSHSIVDLRAACDRTLATLDTTLELVRRVESVLGPPTNLAEIQSAVQRRADIDRMESMFASSQDAMDAAFGTLHSGAETNWTVVEQALSWAETVRNITGGTLPESTARGLLTTTIGRAGLEEPVNRWRRAVDDLLAEFERERADDYRAELERSWDDAFNLLSTLASTPSDVVEWAAFHETLQWFHERGFQPAMTVCVSNRLPAEELSSAIERSLLIACMSHMLRSDHRLRPDRSDDRDALVEQFRHLDAGTVVAASARVINAAAARRPTTRLGETAVIEKEAQKQRRHMPIRELFRQAGTASQRLTPVFMMSPLAVSTYLPSSLRFDVVVFDEASQVRPADAINCLYRASQAIVAGDQRQLPPTSFFDTAVDDATEVWEEDEPESFESVLDLCKGSSAIPSLPLMWHYRSRHEALITFSNRAFYDGHLATFPAARHTGDDVGIEVFKVDGVYDRGKSRTNDIEALKVVERVLFHRREHPDLSLGVVAFSASQQTAIMAALESAAEDHRELSDLVTEDRLNGFFVKNLENVQGDERDIIVFSVGYGPDATGKVALNFGPVSSRAGGWRRLNVAITRARRRVELVTSILPSDLDRAGDNPSLNHFRGYLDYALRGQEARTVQVERAVGQLGTEVAAIIRDWGFEVDEQVGLGDYRVDVAVHHPRRPGEYILGVQCDAPNYARTTTSRDRDRLRPEVLTGLGWHLYHAWSTAWFLDPSGEERRLQNALNRAIEGRARRPSFGPSLREPVEIEHEAVADDERPDWVVDYQAVRLDVPTSHPPDDPRGRLHLLSAVAKVVKREGPVHIDVVQERVRTAWGLQRVGTGTRRAVDDAIGTLVSRGEAERRGDFLWKADTKLKVVRVGREDLPGSVRKVAHVAPEELDLAMRKSLEASGGADVDELKVFVARLFGWRRLGSDISAGLDRSARRVLKSS